MLKSGEPMEASCITKQEELVCDVDEAQTDEDLDHVVRSRAYTWPANHSGRVEIDPSQRGDSGGVSPNSDGAPRNPWGDQSYADIITQAILSSKNRRLLLSQIYEWMVENIPYFAAKAEKKASAGWKNSVRHNLSLQKRFYRINNEVPGMPSWWSVVPNNTPGRHQRRKSVSISCTAAAASAPLATSKHVVKPVIQTSFRTGFCKQRRSPPATTATTTAMTTINEHHSVTSTCGGDLYVSCAEEYSSGGASRRSSGALVVELEYPVKMEVDHGEDGSRPSTSTCSEPQLDPELAEAVRALFPDIADTTYTPQSNTYSEQLSPYRTSETGYDSTNKDLLFNMAAMVKEEDQDQDQKLPSFDEFVSNKISPAQTGFCGSRTDFVSINQSARPAISLAELRPLLIDRKAGSCPHTGECKLRTVSFCTLCDNVVLLSSCKASEEMAKQKPGILIGRAIPLSCFDSAMRN